MKRLSFLLLFCWIWNPEATAQTPYFQGKTIRVLVAYPAGSAHDQWARLIAPQLTRFIPGNPATVVQVMTGAGSMVATNYVYNIAKPDGLTVWSYQCGALFRTTVEATRSEVRLV